MKRKKSLGVNAILNGIKSLMSVLFPLITFPYVSKVIQVGNLGKYNFASSVNSYFLLLAALGISTYAIREGAKYRDNNEDMSKFASEIFTINFISMIVAYILLAVTIFTISKFRIYSVLIWIFSIEIFFNTIGTEWIYCIYEEYEYITKRSIIFQFCSMILLFILVKNPEDYYIYAGITVFATAGSNIINYFNAKKLCNIKLCLNIDWNRHFKPILVIFATTLATTIYVNSDTTILGFLTTDYNVGLYSVSVKIYKIVKTFLSAILIVSIPRLSNYLGTGDVKNYNETFSKIFNVLMVVVVPAMVGLFLLSEQVILIISDSTYVEAMNSLKILSLALFVCIFGWLYNSCVLIPHKKEKKVLIATIVSAFINIILNFILIPIWKQDAAAFTTLLSEACSMIMCIWYSKGLVNVDKKRKDIVSVVVGCIGIVGVCTILKVFSLDILGYTIMATCLSVFVYGATLILFKNTIMQGCFKIIKMKLLISIN